MALVDLWAILLVLARWLPPGILKDLAAVLPSCANNDAPTPRDPRTPTEGTIVVAR